MAKDDPDGVVVALCVFPDLSFIDEWGPAYHSDGTVRGTDLVMAMVYQPNALPPVFPANAGPSTGVGPTTGGERSTSAERSTGATPTS